MPVSEVIVVGAGIAGAATAFFLAERGVRTALVERWRPAGGPTGRSSALTSATTERPGSRRSRYSVSPSEKSTPS